MTILGIDPGKSGAVAVLDEGGELLKVHDTPSTLEPNGRSATNAPPLASILARSHARIAYCEFVGARPTDAKVAAFAFGRERAVTSIAVEVGGVVHLGHHSTGNGMIRVTYGSSYKATQSGGMENAPWVLARIILAEQVREALGHNEGED
jgi:hypothetical protein